MSQRFFTPEDERDAVVIDKAVSSRQRPLQAIDAALAGRDWLIGTQFSGADPNVACVMQTMRRAAFETAAPANLHRWLAACSARPALARAHSAFSRHHPKARSGFRSDALSVLLFPLAALFIAWKKLGRVVLSIVAVAAPPAMGVAGAMLLKLAFGLRQGRGLLTAFTRAPVWR